MKHNIIEKRYKKTLDRLDFVIEDRYYCEVYEMEYQDYCLRIYDLENNRQEIYSVWFDEALGIVAGNEEQYTLEDIQDVINTAFNVILHNIQISYVQE